MTNTFSPSLRAKSTIVLKASNGALLKGVWLKAPM